MKKENTYIVIKQTATVRELLFQAANTLHQNVTETYFSVHGQILYFESRTTLEDNNIFNQTTVCLITCCVMYAMAYCSLTSHCEDCWMNRCPFDHLLSTWNLHELSKTHKNAYLILCKAFSLPSNIIKIIEDNCESNAIRLGDVLHRICHKNPNLTREEVIEIIGNGKLKQPEDVTPAASLYSHCEGCGMDDDCLFKNRVDKWNVHELSQTHGNAYLILCQKFDLPSDIIKTVEDNHEESHIRLGDVLHHICHKKPNLTLEEVIEIIKLRQSEDVPPAASISSLYSHCKDCGMDDCSFKNLVDKWNIYELSQKHGNAYLILCQKYGLSSDIIKAVEDNHEESHIRLDDILHHICHKNPNLTREEVIEIISNGISQESEISQRESAGNSKDQSETSTRNVYCTCL